MVPLRRFGEFDMNALPKVLAVALTIAVSPWLAPAAVAAPLSSSLSLPGTAAAAGPSVETVQYRRGWRGGYRGGYRHGIGGAGIGIVGAPSLAVPSLPHS